MLVWRRRTCVLCARACVQPRRCRGGRASATVEMNEIRAAAAAAAAAATRENHRRPIRNGRQRRRRHSGVWEVVYFQGRYRKIRPLKTSYIVLSHVRTNRTQTEMPTGRNKNIKY